MGGLQPGLSSPTGILLLFSLVVTDIKDFFKNCPFYPQDINILPLVYLLLIIKPLCAASNGIYCHKEWQMV